MNILQRLKRKKQLVNTKNQLSTSHEVEKVSSERESLESEKHDILRLIMKQRSIEGQRLKKKLGSRARLELGEDLAKIKAALTLLLPRLKVIRNTLDVLELQSMEASETALILSELECDEVDREHANVDNKETQNIESEIILYDFDDLENVEKKYLEEDDLQVKFSTFLVELLNQDNGVCNVSGENLWETIRDLRPDLYAALETGEITLPELGFNVPDMPITVVDNTSANSVDVLPIEGAVTAEISLLDSVTADQWELYSKGVQIYNTEDYAEGLNVFREIKEQVGTDILHNMIAQNSENAESHLLLGDILKEEEGAIQIGEIDIGNKAAKLEKSQDALASYNFALAIGGEHLHGVERAYSYRIECGIRSVIHAECGSFEMNDLTEVMVSHSVSSGLLDEVILDIEKLYILNKESEDDTRIREIIEINVAEDRIINIRNTIEKELENAGHEISDEGIVVETLTLAEEKFQVGLALFNSDKKDQALGQFVEANTLIEDGEYADALIYMGHCHRSTGDVSDQIIADDLYDRAIEIDDHNPLLSYVYRYKGNKLLCFKSDGFLSKRSISDEALSSAASFYTKASLLCTDGSIKESEENIAMFKKIKKVIYLRKIQGVFVGVISSIACAVVSVKLADHFGVNHIESVITAGAAVISGSYFFIEYANKDLNDRAKPINSFGKIVEQSNLDENQENKQ